MLLDLIYNSKWRFTLKKPKVLYSHSPLFLGQKSKSFILHF